MPQTLLEQTIAIYFRSLAWLQADVVPVARVSGRRREQARSSGNSRMGFALARTAAQGMISLHHVLDATQQAETLPRIPPAQDSISCRRRGGHWIQSAACEFSSRREPMYLAGRTCPHKRGRTINSCVFFTTNRQVSRFLSTTNKKNGPNFAVDRPKGAELPICRVRLTPEKVPRGAADSATGRRPRAISCRQPPLLAKTPDSPSNPARRVDKVCPKSPTGATDTNRWVRGGSMRCRAPLPRTRTMRGNSCHAIGATSSAFSPAS